jgi:23S rRNA-/tRNA-specific pseudouridylate synthase
MIPEVQVFSKCYDCLRLLSSWGMINIRMTKKQPRERLDVLLVERDLASSRTKAQRLIRAGLVRIADQVFDKPGTQVATDADIVVQARPRFASRRWLVLG